MKSTQTTKKQKRERDYYDDDWDDQERKFQDRYRSYQRVDRELDFYNPDQRVIPWNEVLTPDECRLDFRNERR